ncbi:hypothetical protein M8C21_006329 [Ambrosia artemisiifolia]|uniref:Uncharacterized protein n=1 Tax=Ambrosia artemisiifolia TaxID=4212 RepID=A0AAD5CJ86_AMBAR|nr:hypothetical protein M8C21_006329 [Ambrosia artemisiifolia]
MFQDFITYKTFTKPSSLQYFYYRLCFSTCNLSSERKILNCLALMSGRARSRRNNKPSINYKYNPHGGASFDVADVIREDYAPNSHNDAKKPANQAEGRSSVLSTAYVISGAGQLWNFATSSLPVRHRTTSAQNTEILQKENTLYYPAEEGKIVASISSEGQNVSVNLKAGSDISPSVNVQKDLDFVHVAKKLGCLSESHIYDYLLRCINTHSGKTILSSDEKRVSSVRILDGLQNVYGWMNTVQLMRPTYNAGEINNFERSDPGDATTSDNGMTSENDVCYNGIAENQESLSDENTKNMIERNPEVMIMPADYLIQQVSQHEKEDNLFETNEGKKSQLLNQESSVAQIFTSSSSHKSQYGLAKQEHAFAGAFAGTFVSLCLHPMDTVKTVVQSCHADQRSISYISKSIISERGLLGLYRGIASNIASSAPISAIYTFSYESVKAALLPLFAKEYHSLAHCVAGGCASVATSFVFTPSERIKQQMQVGSHYRSCWNALLGIIGKGGFLSLYNGWGAVLCRNVPHSIIKFYTYESLKSVLLTSSKAHGQPTTISTLLCGGLAGSTAALFTTPFDVVKTRLQTQIPGTADRYNGVYNTLRDIAQHEGLQGLYRGLTPRLVMYMTQGALFFASYESFKGLFSLEATQLEPTSKGVIDFYTYESLKNVLLTSNDTHSQPTTIATLLCGGLAGSTAALFTTPFDVVKTRLQTQIPGSADRYNGVYNTLRDIAQHEGLQGLYRGLTPRLVMYMTQGALFFGSYESFKRLFSLEVTQLEPTTNSL